jgi:DNA-directed RNA polymerase I subunit RPA2
MRCVRHNGDETSITNTLHYLTTGGATLRFVARKQEFLIPVILLLRILSGPEKTQQSSSADAAAGIGSGLMMGVTDEELYNRIVHGNTSNTFLVARAGLLLQDARARYPYLNTPIECLEYIGSRFRRIIQKSETASDAEIGHAMIRKYVLIHLSKYRDKLECMLFMLRKVYAFAAGECGPDNPDSLQNHELMLPGHFMCAFVKEKFVESLEQLRDNIRIQMRKSFTQTLSKMDDPKYWASQVDRASSKANGGIGKKVSYLLATGNVISSTGLDLMQTSGYTIVAERINFLRYCSHFQSVHRGSFFMEMKTTAVRKLLPDGWGFLCPVHTPDGGPCGLLNHLAIACKVLSFPDKLSSTTSLDALLISIGVTPNGAGGYDGDGRTSSTYHHIPVCLDGRVVGSATPQMCKIIVAQLRQYKVMQQASERKVPATMECAYIPPGSPGAPYSGLYMFTGSARMVRPVLHRASGAVEYIGPLEQGFMDIACLESDIREGVTTHQELDPTNMLNQLANMTPFSDQNQSPRNMYQCQMAKQTMGTPCHGIHYRADNKLYRLTTPQAPICQTAVHGKYKVDEFPNGTNAVVGTYNYDSFHTTITRID